MAMVVEIRRSPQAVACRKRYIEEPEKPQEAPDEVTRRTRQRWDTGGVKSPETAWARGDRGNRERFGR